MKRVTFFLLILLLLSNIAITSAQQTEDTKPPYFTDIPKQSLDAGYFKLSWENPSRPSPLFEVQESKEDSFSTAKTVYKGPDLATFISGLPNGTYYYRIRSLKPKSAWSSPTKIEVTHHSLTFAFTLAGIGALVFFFTVGVIVVGIRKNKTNI